MKNILYIAAGGCAGAIARYALSRYINLVTGSVFPWGTMFVNLTGSFFIGFFFDLFEAVLAPSGLRGLIMIGFLGAYTTFSTYSLETLNLFKEGELRLGIMNVFISTVSGLLCVILGIYASRMLLKIVR